MSRWFDGTLVAGIEISPLGSLIAPLGSGSVTIADSLDSTVVEPTELRAPRLKRILWPTSADVSRYVRAVAPPIDVHSPPCELQRSQRYENEMDPAPLHVPGLAVASCPFTLLP